MKTPEEIIQELKSADDGIKQRSSTSNLLKAITTDAKLFFTNLFTKIADRLVKNKFNVEVKNQIKLPEVQKIDGEVSIKDTKALLVGLNEIVRGVEKAKTTYEKATKDLEKALKPEKVDFSKLEKAISEIYIPEPLKEVSVDNLPPDLSPKLDLIKKEISKLKLDPKIEVKAEAPKVSIDLEGVKKQLKAIEKMLDKPDEEEPIGFSWKKNREGILATLTEIYPSGKVISTGWDIGQVKIDDQRN